MSETIFENPLQKNSRSPKIADPCIMVIFGATGDLTSRKLLPALYNLVQDGELPAHFACVGFARRDKTNEQFRDEMFEAINKFSRTKPIEKEIWEAFKNQIFYHKSEFDDDKGYDELNELLSDLDAKFGTKGNRLYYLSTQPSYFPDIIKRLHEHKLIYPVKEVKNKWTRVIIEKPFGHDLESAEMLQTEISNYLDESQIYRIDHYLGKETVQNLLVFRFSNLIFESIWNNHYIDQVQITVAEEIGIGTRGRFFEEAGIIRDIVQNHMMQLLSLVAMEPPTSMRANSIRDEKVKVVEAIRPIPQKEFDKYAVRGQYGKGYIDGLEVEGYREEENVAKDSNVETYLALKLYIDNWRWDGVPFYLRAGKRLPKRATEITITFKNAPGSLFCAKGKKLGQNILVIRIQPDEGISLKMNCKVPGITKPLQPVKMDFKYNSYFGSAPPEAYERLISDCMAGDSTLFARIDEVLASWKLLTPLIKYFELNKADNFPNYPAGSFGPKAADELLLNDGFQWRLI